MAWEKTEDWENALAPLGMVEFFRDTQIPESIEDILADGNWEVIFHQYTQAEFASENVDFLRAVRTFEISGDLNQAAEIYKEFVPEAAPRQVNLSSATRADLEAIFGPDKDGVGPPNIFDTAKAEITRMIRADTFPRFKRSGAKAQEEMAAGIDWDQVQGREHSAAVSGGAGGADAAWHPDPSGRHELRYWDGTAWTDHVSDGGTTSTDVLMAS